MAWNGSGTFSRTNGVNTGTTVWQDDAAAATKIRADYHDTHDQDIATGINACLAKNGENNMTGPLNMGSQKIQSLAAGSSASDGVRHDQVYLLNGGNTPSADLSFNSLYHLTNLAAGSAAADSVRYDQVALLDGSNTMTGNLPMGTTKLTGLGAGTTAGDSVRYEQVLLLAGGTMSGNIAMGSNKLTGLAAGSTAGDSVRYEQVLLLSGGTMSGNIAMGTNKLTGLAAGSTNGDSVRYEQVLLLSGGTMAGNIAMGSNKLTGLAAGTTNGDSVRYEQISDLVNGWKLLGTATASTSSEITFTSLIDTTYDMYMVTWDRVIPASAGAYLYCQISETNGSSWLNSGTAYKVGAINAQANTAQNQIDITGNTLTTGAGRGTQGSITFYNVHGTGTYPGWRLSCNYWNASIQPWNYEQHGIFNDGGGTDVDAVRLYMSTGNISSGNFAIYGLAKT